MASRPSPRFDSQRAPEASTDGISAERMKARPVYILPYVSILSPTFSVVLGAPQALLGVHKQ